MFISSNNVLNIQFLGAAAGNIEYRLSGFAARMLNRPSLAPPSLLIYLIYSTTAGVAPSYPPQAIVRVLRCLSFGDCGIFYS